MSPILVEKVQQHCQGLSAQPEVLPGVTLIKKFVQDRHGQVDPAVQGSGLDWEKEGKNRRKKWLIKQ